MKTIKLAFGKDKTAIIKGIAILFMIILHCGIPEYWDAQLGFADNKALVDFLKTFKLCVGIFTFMVGYGYAFSKDKDWKYSLQHIKRLLIPYWTILFVFTIPLIMLKSELGGADLFLKNLIGVSSNYNWFSWFVTFFIYAMIVMPFFSRIIDKSPIVSSAILIVFTFLVEVVVHEYIPLYTENDWTQRLFDCMLCSPGMILGYLFAKKSWFCNPVPNHWSMMILAFCMIVGVFLCRFYLAAILGFNLDFFYAPLFIYSVLIIFNLVSIPILSRILAAFGNVSVYMWFFHALFFTTIVLDVYQPFILVSNNIFVIILWTIFLTYICSWILKIIVDNIEGLVSKYI